MKEKSFVYIWGVLRGTYIEPKFTKFSGQSRSHLMTSSQSRHMYNKGTTKFSYMRLNVNKLAFLAIRGAWVALQLSDWPQLASQLSHHLYQSTYKIWTHSVQDLLTLSRSQRNVCGRSGVTMTKKHSIPRVHSYGGYNKHQLDQYVCWFIGKCWSLRLGTVTVGTYCLSPTQPLTLYTWYIHVQDDIRLLKIQCHRRCIYIFRECTDIYYIL